MSFPTVVHPAKIGDDKLNAAITVMFSQILQHFHTHTQFRVIDLDEFQGQTAPTVAVVTTGSVDVCDGRISNHIVIPHPYSSLHAIQVNCGNGWLWPVAQGHEALKEQLCLTSVCSGNRSWCLWSCAHQLTVHDLPPRVYSSSEMVDN